ncbi:hypothetical protein GE21DRAFT_9531 [Neurospora crassa]|uniref:DUF7587 domain-containing protein n=1 Tax=Neurospora crassa (strain ATCC 24698 / 74-OR23-1A / CBS 708.71 / DSM 1257 / FGSC 987) TaxID=367110 RepID=Q7RWL0_NEUCR|nr:hypothetical protein NCU05074 [Neurospora crassa OR74A]EAA26827.2 hypothetical protein NCU05074 [Neurospora crassa OR74A]KHE83864.1 hypothetical protein GE21DRAFT_9531 [Neurospora crassa]|eukprot:XP_956063.2 hypothetical protein NCU05074 [Neurospora crassa OR74A]
MSQPFWHTVPSPEDTEPIPNLKLPPKLWHVQHFQSRSINLKDGGFQARNPFLDIRTCDALKMEAGRHFRWGTRDWDSCFLSAFDDQVHADNWAKLWCLEKPVLVYELDTSKLPAGTTLFQSTALCRSLDIGHPWMEDEWIFYQQIPASCIARRYYPWSNYERIFQSPIHLTVLAEVLVGAEWLPPRNTDGPRPPSPAETEEDQDDLDALTGRMNGLELENDASISEGDACEDDESTQEAVKINPADDAPNGIASAPEKDVDANPIVCAPNHSDSVRQEGTDSRLTDDIPKTNNAATEDTDPTPTVDTPSTPEMGTDTQLSGETIVAEDPTQGEEVINSVSKDDSSRANSGGPIQQKIICQVNKEISGTKSTFSVMVQFEIRAAEVV